MQFCEKENMMPRATKSMKHCSSSELNLNIRNNTLVKYTIVLDELYHIAISSTSKMCFSTEYFI